MFEIESNKQAWSKIAQDHYYHFKALLSSGNYQFNQYIQKELGDLSGKEIIHLQCNTGADTLTLAKTAKSVSGVDLVPDNIFFARKLAHDLDVKNVKFIESDIMTLSAIHHEKYDIVFTSEGALGWLPDLNIWANTIRGLLKDDGYLYIFDSHPFFLCFDESKLDKEIFEIKYPYFSKTPDLNTSIGGYACEPKTGVKAYFWMYTVSDIINSLTKAGLHIEYFNEYTENFFDSGNMKASSEKKGLYTYPYNTDQYPMSFSLKASVYPGK
ncbi:MAG TPA: class I SAM-dependent methyltransferase [Firmicutes bacterium]|nr:class I SAM-dependent methyltransferase [Bacillota bacterium]